MERICDYCGSKYDDGLDVCPHCGAPNNFIRRGTGVPRTIEELKQWYKDANLPPEETTRFFIGRNYTEKRAFGIYKDERTGDFIVYKNKDNGQRAIRYQGKDEAYAVNELYLRLKEEITNQKAHRGMRFGGSPSGSKAKKAVGSCFGTLVYITIIIVSPLFAFNIGYITNSNGSWGIFCIALPILLLLLTTPHKNGVVRTILIVLAFMLCIFGYRVGVSNVNNGYYSINGDNYYKKYNHWYVYKDNEWKKSDSPEYEYEYELNDSYNGETYDSSSDYSDFKDSDYYYSSDGWSDSDSWDSGSSWDSDNTDFSSDW